MPVKTYLKVLAPLVQHLLHHPVHVRIQECGVPAGCRHGVVEQSTHGHAHHADVLGRIRPLRGAREDVVQDREHVSVVPDLFVAGGVLLVGPLVGDLVPHLREEHADPRVRLDKVFEFLQYGDEPLRILVDVVGLLLQPLLMYATVGRKPAAGPVYLVVLRDVMVVSVLLDHVCGVVRCCRICSANGIWSDR